MSSGFRIATLSDLFRSLSARKIKPNLVIEILSKLCRMELTSTAAAQLLESEILISEEVLTDDEKLRDFLKLMGDRCLKLDKGLIAIITGLYEGSVCSPDEAVFEVGALMDVIRRKSENDRESADAIRKV